MIKAIIVGEPKVVEARTVTFTGLRDNLKATELIDLIACLKVTNSEKNPLFFETFTTRIETDPYKVIFQPIIAVTQFTIYKIIFTDAKKSIVSYHDLNVVLTRETQFNTNWNIGGEGEDELCVM